MTQPTAEIQVVEWTIQVLIEMKDGRPVPPSIQNYVKAAILGIFAKSRDVRTVVTITDGDENVISVDYGNNPTAQLRERAWT